MLMSPEILVAAEDAKSSDTEIIAPEGALFLEENDRIAAIGQLVVARCGECLPRTLAALVRDPTASDGPDARRAVCPAAVLLARQTTPDRSFEQLTEACAARPELTTVVETPLVARAQKIGELARRSPGLRSRTGSRSVTLGSYETYSQEII